VIVGGLLGSVPVSFFFLLFARRYIFLFTPDVPEHLVTCLAGRPAQCFRLTNSEPARAPIPPECSTAR